LSGKTLTAKILEYIHDNPGASLKDLSRELGIGVNTLRTILYRLKNNGYVEKAGDGYILTSKGEWFVNKILRGEASTPVEEKPSIEAEQTEEVEVSTQPQTMMERERIRVEEEISMRIESLEKRIEDLNKLVETLYKELELIKRELKRAKHVESASDVEKKELARLPEPVMNIKEAYNALGPVLEELKLRGRVEVVGNVVVDSNFYNEFKKKFPIQVSEVDKLSNMERILLDEMIRDARVIKHGGREYRLIS